MLWKPCRKFANLSYFRLPAPIGQNFNRISINFYSGSKNFMTYIPTHSEGRPCEVKKIAITLVYEALNSKQIDPS